MRLHGLPPGAYTETQIDTNTGDVVSTTRARCTAGEGLPLKIASVSTDVAVKVTAAK